MLGVVPTFAKKLFDILSTDDAISYSEIIRWSDSGESFLILKPHKFLKKISPKYFTFHNFSSFIRQLNFYGFKKLKNKLSSEVLEFQHENFLANKPHLLQHITRKQTKSNSSQLNSGNASISYTFHPMQPTTQLPTSSSSPPHHHTSPSSPQNPLRTSSLPTNLNDIRQSHLQSACNLNVQTSAIFPNPTSPSTSPSTTVTMTSFGFPSPIFSNSSPPSSPIISPQQRNVKTKHHRKECPQHITPQSSSSSSSILPPIISLQSSTCYSQSSDDDDDDDEEIENEDSSQKNPRSSSSPTVSSSSSSSSLSPPSVKLPPISSLQYSQTQSRSNNNINNEDKNHHHHQSPQTAVIALESLRRSTPPIRATSSAPSPSLSPSLSPSSSSPQTYPFFPIPSLSLSSASKQNHFNNNIDNKIINSDRFTTPECVAANYNVSNILITGSGSGSGSGSTSSCGKLENEHFIRCDNCDKLIVLPSNNSSSSPSSSSSSSISNSGNESSLILRIQKLEQELQFKEEIISIMQKKLMIDYPYLNSLSDLLKNTASSSSTSTDS